MYDLKAELLFLKHLCNLLKRLFNLFYLLLHPLCVLLLLDLLEAPCSQNSRLKEKSSDKKSISQSWADTMLTKKWTVFKSIFKWRNISIISPWWLPCRFPEPESQRSVEHWTPPFPQGLFGQTPWFMINFHGDDGFGDNYHDDNYHDDDDTYSRGMDQGPSHQGKSLFHPSISTIGACSYFDWGIIYHFYQSTLPPFKSQNPFLLNIFSLTLSYPTHPHSPITKLARKNAEYSTCN